LIQTNGPESADIDEAEMLARKAVQILKELETSSGCDIVNAEAFYNTIITSFNNLVKVLFQKYNFSDDTKSLLKDHLNYVIRRKGGDHLTSGNANQHLGLSHYMVARDFPVMIQVMIL
jgi:hypothetical protein